MDHIIHKLYFCVPKNRRESWRKVITMSNMKPRITFNNLNAEWNEYYADGGGNTNTRNATRIMRKTKRNVFFGNNMNTLNMPNKLRNTRRKNKIATVVNTNEEPDSITEIQIAEQEIQEIGHIVDLYLNIEKEEDVEPQLISFFNKLYDIEERQEENPEGNTMEGGAVEGAKDEEITEPDILEGIQIFITIPELIGYQTQLATLEGYLKLYEGRRNESSQFKARELIGQIAAIKDKIQRLMESEDGSRIEEGNVVYRLNNAEGGGRSRKKRITRRKNSKKMKKGARK
jgi:hypothetical protein